MTIFSKFQVFLLWAICSELKTRVLPLFLGQNCVQYLAKYQKMTLAKLHI